MKILGKKKGIVTRTVSGITTGSLLCKRIASTQFEALLNNATNTLFSVKKNDLIVDIVIVVQNASGIIGTIDVGPDVDVDGTAADIDGFIVDANSNLKGVYRMSDVANFGGVDAHGMIAADDGNIEILSSADVSGGTLIGHCYMYYVPASKAD